MADPAGAFRKCLGSSADGLDENLVQYMCEIVSDVGSYDTIDELIELIGPFLEDTGSYTGVDISRILSETFAIIKGKEKEKAEDTGHLVRLDAAVTMNTMDDTESRAAALLWKPPRELVNLSEQQRMARLENDLAKAEAKIAKKNQDKEEKDAKRAITEARLREEQRNIIQSHIVLSGKAASTDINASKDIRVQPFSMFYGGTELLTESPLNLAWSHRYGLVGRNGVGKTTLLRHLAHRDVPIPAHFSILYVAQEAAATEISALETVLAADTVRADLLLREKEILARIESAGDSRTDDDAKALDIIHARLLDIDADTAETRAAKILSGLQFTTEMQAMPTQAFSGGWRMRIALASALFCPPDLLILDEPTNHLDIPACLWLQDYLSKWETTMLVVSHSREFLNAICTDIVHMFNNKLNFYHGNYDTYLKTRQDREKAQAKAFINQQSERAHMEKFVTKFRYMTSGARMAQSRLKKLEKMVLVESVVQEAEFSLEFKSPEPMSGPIIRFEDAGFTYDPNKPELFSHLTLTISMESRISLIGANGVGKSTLLKLLTGDLVPTSGLCLRSSKARMARFEQHFVDSLDLDTTPLDLFKSMYPNEELKDIRAYLGRFGLTGDQATQSIATLSGGQKSRVVFAKIAKNSPHILILDEPTNHLDMQAIDALILALNDFEGAVVLVSHDQRLISMVSNELWICEPGRVTPFEGDFDQYREKFEAEAAAAAAEGSGSR